MNQLFRIVAPFIIGEAALVTIYIVSYKIPRKKSHNNYLLLFRLICGGLILFTILILAIAEFLF